MRDRNGWKDFLMLKVGFQPGLPSHYKWATLRKNTGYGFYFYWPMLPIREGLTVSSTAYLLMYFTETKLPLIRLWCNMHFAHAPKVYAFIDNRGIEEALYIPRRHSGEQRMKRYLIMVAVMALAIPLMAQETNKVQQVKPKVKPAESTATATQPKKNGSSKPRREKFQERHLRLMARALDKIGVTDEQRQQIFALQKEHLKKMRANWIRLNKARRTLSKLQDEGASEKELDAAIQEVSDAQTEQLKILVKNRMEMEKILGKEKNDRLMAMARQYFREHGRRPGRGMPPRPDLPPIPGHGHNSGNPPLPPSGSNTNAPPPPA